MVKDRHLGQTVAILENNLAAAAAVHRVTALASFKNKKTGKTALDTQPQLSQS
jgi:hypothetical protein